MPANPPQRYGAVSRSLHWSVALLIIGLLWLGWYMVDLTYFDRWYSTSLETHKSLGITVLALAVCSAVWKVCCRSPRFVASLEAWERYAARIMHMLLYLMMLLIPLSGYVISTSSGSAVSFFGWFDIPAVLPENDGLREWATRLHYYCAYGTALLVAMHALAAVKHHFVDRDGTLRRMLWD